MTRINPYDLGLDKNEANFIALSPLSFIERAASVYPDRIALIYGLRRQTWRETYARSRRLASALAQRDIGVGDTVAVMLPNVPAMFEAHFGVPMTGAVLNTLNTRLDAEAIAFTLQHGDAKVLLVDHEFAGTVGKALPMLGPRAPFVIDVEDDTAPPGHRLGGTRYESFLEGDATLIGIAGTLGTGLTALTEATDWLLAASPRKAAAGAVPYLKLSGTVIAGWLMSRAAQAATKQLARGTPADSDFLSAKRITAQHYALHVMPLSGALRDTVLHGAATTLGLSDAQF